MFAGRLEEACLFLSRLLDTADVDVGALLTLVRILFLVDAPIGADAGADADGYADIDTGTGTGTGIDIDTDTAC